MTKPLAASVTALVTAAWLGLAACNGILGIDDAVLRETGVETSMPEAVAEGATDAGVDGSTCDPNMPPIDAAPSCNPEAGFGSPVPILDTPNADEVGGFVSPDGQEIYFAARAAKDSCGINCGLHGYQVYVATFDNGMGTFTNPKLVAAANEVDPNLNGTYHPALSADGLTLYFFSYGKGREAIYSTTRANRCAPWGPASAVNNLYQPINGYVAADPYPIAGAIYVSNADIYRCAINAGAIGAPVYILGGVDKQVSPVVTPDELNMYFGSDLSASYQFHIYQMSRATDGGWGVPQLLPSPPNTTTSGDSQDTPSYITPDNCTLYYTSTGGPNLGMYKITRGK